jgi:DNA-binding phage protein
VKRKTLTRKTVGDKLVTMTIQELLRELVNKRGLRKVARELDIDHASLYRSLNSDLRLSTIQAILNLFGYDLKIVKRKEVKPVKSKPSRSRRTKKGGGLNGDFSRVSSLSQEAEGKE